MITWADLPVLSPLLILAGTAIVVLLALTIRRDARVAAGISMAGFAAALLALTAPAMQGYHPVTALLTIDRTAVLFQGILLGAGLLVTMLADGYFRTLREPREEFYLLWLLAVVGAMVMAASAHVAAFFLGLEILSVSLYALIAYPRHAPKTIEAGVKYLILAGASSAFILFGMALIYAASGALAFADIATRLAVAPTDALLVGGVLLLLVGVGFKLALVPFHFWTPDIYEGAPLPVSAAVATVSKGAAFAVLTRLLLDVPQAQQGHRALALAFLGLALASMIVGNLLALAQGNLKRLLAYSSIANMGYALTAFIAGGDAARVAIPYFFAGYIIAALLAFGVMTLLSTPDRELQHVDDYRGLAWRAPWLAALLTAALLSLAGIPLTVGFMGKFFVLNAGVAAGQWALVITLVLTSGLGLYYYLRVITALYQTPDDDAPPPVLHLPRVLPVLGGLALAILAALLLLLGLYPAPLLG
jgi:NADH-quinone oxidoreductase subunit N